MKNIKLESIGRKNIIQACKNMNYVQKYLKKIYLDN